MSWKWVWDKHSRHLDCSVIWGEPDIMEILKYCLKLFFFLLNKYFAPLLGSPKIPQEESPSVLNAVL